MGSRNRVAPTGEIVESSLRCAWMGNRGCLHRGREVVRPWRTTAWITCVLEFKDRWIEQWVAGRCTVLFFHDEAVALAAGHRPCAECRRADYNRFRDAWDLAHGARPSARELDAALHADRLDGTSARTHRLPWVDVPDGAFVRVDAGPALVVGDAIVSWSGAHGYQPAEPRPRIGDVEVLTPSRTVEVIRAGYAPQVAAQALALATDVARLA
jgi:hypothetical protein